MNSKSLGDTIQSHLVRTATVVASVGTKQQAVLFTVVAGTNERYGGKKTTGLNTIFQTIGVKELSSPQNEYDRSEIRLEEQTRSR